MDILLTGLILIVDDTPTNLEVICDALSDAGFDVAIATGGERALQQIEREIPDLILLDIMMPGIDGFETCKRLKANPMTCEIPVIFMTALSDIDSKVEALELGAVDYVTKPFQEREVLARVKTHLQLRRLTQQLEQEVRQKNAELQTSQLQLIQNEKMSALGGLVAGVAHEINNPVGFICGNLQPAEDYIQDLFSLIDLYEKKYPDLDPEIEEKISDIDLDYIRNDLPKLIASMKLGVERIAHISIALRTFSRTDQDYKVPFNIHDGIDSTLLILKHRLKANEKRPEIQVISQYGNCPDIPCFPGQINQVFMNLLSNAIDALEEGNEKRTFAEIKANPNRITIQTQVTSTQIMIQISDNGGGMPEAVKQRIFEQGFTTKGVGKGTGLGLAIARQIVEEQHGGTLSVTSTLDHGTEFTIVLNCHEKPFPSRQPELVSYR